MLTIDDISLLAAEYERASDTPETTLSFRVFGDSKKLRAIRSGADLTTSRFNSALHWFSNNWPPGAIWPASVKRPAPSKQETAA